jgi:hypothetical protein
MIKNVIDQPNIMFLSFCFVRAILNFLAPSGAEAMPFGRKILLNRLERGRRPQPLHGAYPGPDPMQIAGLRPPITQSNRSQVESGPARHPARSPLSTWFNNRDL